MIPIAYCIHGLSLGGAERHLLKVFKSIDRRRFQPMLFCLGSASSLHLLQELERLRVELVNIGLEGKHSWANLKRLLGMAVTMRRRHVKVVHGYLLEGNLVGVLMGRVAGVPVCIASKRSNAERFTTVQYWLSYLTNRLATKVTANSVAVRDFAVRVERCPRRKLAVVPNGTEIGTSTLSLAARAGLKTQWAIPQDAYVVGTVARFFWKKGYEHFLQMASLVLEKRPKVYFVAIGDGPLKGSMEETARQMGIAERVVFVGWQADAALKMQVFDLYVCPSIIEGMSNALLEAMANGLPVVATAVGGNLETVTEGITGLLVPPANPSAMADAVIKFVDDPVLGLRLGEAGRLLVASKYTTKAMIRRMEDLYDSLLAQKTLQ